MSVGMFGIRMKTKASSYLSFLSDNIEELRASSTPLWHPLGFVSCIIKQDKDHTIRVHLWPESERRVKNPDWPIHTHAYYLSSYVLEGSIRDVRYETIENGDYVAYAVRYFKGGSEISQTKGRVGVKAVIDESRAEGESYEVAINVFHQSSVPVDRSAITLVALSNFSDSPPLVLGSLAADKYPYDRTPYDKNVFWQRVSDAIEKTLNKSKHSHGVNAAGV